MERYTIRFGLQYGFENYMQKISNDKTSIITRKIKKYSKMEKMTKNNGWIIAGSGDSTPCDILQYIFIPPVPSVKERENLYKFMITKFVPAMRECLEENNWKPDPNDKDSGFAALV